MAKVQVKATKLGYCEDKRQREGSVFWMDEKHMKKDKDGKAELPSWVEYASKKKAKIESPPEEEVVTEDEVI